MRLMKFATVVAVVAVLSCVKSASAVTIISDTFTTASNVTLNGRAPDQAQPGNTSSVWGINNSSANDLTVGGGVLTMARTNNQYMKAILPFNGDNVVQPVTLSWDMTILPGTDNAFSYYGGFGNGSPDGAAFADNTLLAGFNFSNADLTGTSFSLRFGNGSTTTSNPTTITRADTSSPYVFSLSVTRDANNLFTGSIDGTPVGTFTNASHIGGLWFKGDNLDVVASMGGAQITMDNVAVNAAAAPEPSSAAAAFLAVSLLGLRRRRRTA